MALQIIWFILWESSGPAISCSYGFDLGAGDAL